MKYIKLSKFKNSGKAETDTSVYEENYLID